jgi:hypothetical protein
VKRASPTPALSDALRQGVDALTIDGLDVLAEPIWDRTHGRWVLRCGITIRPAPNSLVPPRTTWCVLIDEIYPAGRITIYPATVGGITDTFPHQTRNKPGPVGQAWRSGDICVHQGSRALGRLGGSTEPLDAGLRLAWRLERAVDWVQAASCGALVGSGDPFELPDFGGGLSEVVAFSEDHTSFRMWEAGAPVLGTVELYCPTGITKGPSRTVARAYRSTTGEIVYEPRWGKAFEPRSPRHITVGIWVRLPQVPYLPSWRAPETWGELVQCVAREGVDLDALVAGASSRLRDFSRPLLLCGFPMPARQGEENVEYFWQALKLPTLARAKGQLRGFRNTEQNRKFVDRITRFRSDAPLSWLRSENWHPSTRSARGRFSDALTGRRVLLIGGGAVGAVIAELLVRGGLERVTICEGQLTFAGNLARHTLTLPDVGSGKATGLADRLNQASPHARADVLGSTFPPTDPDDIALARRADLIIDCTGEDEVALTMGGFDWGGEKKFCSISLDWQARRLFSFLACGPVFPAQAFLTAVRAHLDQDPDERLARDLAREGVGCWHPVMPARVDDVWMLAATAVRELDQSLALERNHDHLVVFERDEALPFGGVRRAS